MSLSLATDLGMGLPLEHALRSTLLAVRLGEAAGLTDAQLADVYYLSLVAFVGCTTDAQVAAERFGDETSGAGVEQWLTADFGRPAEAMAFVMRNAGLGRPPLQRAQALASLLLAGKRAFLDSSVAHCEVGQRLAARLDLGPEVQRSLWQVYERWDGKGMPHRLKGEELSVPIRVVQIAQEAEVFYRIGGTETAVALVRRKSGTQYDPGLAQQFCRQATQLLSLLECESIWEEVLSIEPGPQPYMEEGQLDTAARAVADFADLKTPYTANHSSGVAELAAGAAHRYGLARADVAAVRRAALLHDVGRVGVSAGIWCKPGRLTDGEWERVRLYPYYTERVLARPRALAHVAKLAALHRERLDGSGYHRSLTAPLLLPAARILAAADVYHAMIEPRPHRPALPDEAAAAELRKEVRAGRLDGEAAGAVLVTAGNATRATAPRERTAGLSEREVEVLRLLARGLSMREIAEALTVSRKTVDNHIQHIYNKIGVSTRAAATFFAMQHDLLNDLRVT